MRVLGTVLVVALAAVESTAIVLPGMVSGPTVPAQGMPERSHLSPHNIKKPEMPDQDLPDRSRLSPHTKVPTVPAQGMPDRSHLSPHTKVPLIPTQGMPDRSHLSPHTKVPSTPTQGMPDRSHLSPHSNKKPEIPDQDLPGYSDLAPQGKKEELLAGAQHKSDRLKTDAQDKMVCAPPECGPHPRPWRFSPVRPPYWRPWRPWRLGFWDGNHCGENGRRACDGEDQRHNQRCSGLASFFRPLGPYWIWRRPATGCEPVDANPGGHCGGGEKHGCSHREPEEDEPRPFSTGKKHHGSHDKGEDKGDESSSTVIVQCQGNNSTSSTTEVTNDGDVIIHCNGANSTSTVEMNGGSHRTPHGKPRNSTSTSSSTVHRCPYGDSARGYQNCSHTDPQRRHMPLLPRVVRQSRQPFSAAPPTGLPAPRTLTGWNDLPRRGPQMDTAPTPVRLDGVHAGPQMLPHADTTPFPPDLTLVQQKKKEKEEKQKYKPLSAKDIPGSARHRKRGAGHVLPREEGEGEDAISRGAEPEIPTQTTRTPRSSPTSIRKKTHTPPSDEHSSGATGNRKEGASRNPFRDEDGVSRGSGPRTTLPVDKKTSGGTRHRLRGEAGHVPSHGGDEDAVSRGSEPEILPTQTTTTTTSSRSTPTPIQKEADVAPSDKDKSGGTEESKGEVGDVPSGDADGASDDAKSDTKQPANHHGHHSTKNRTKNHKNGRTKTTTWTTTRTNTRTKTRTKTITHGKEAGQEEGKKDRKEATMGLGPNKDSQSADEVEKSGDEKDDGNKDGGANTLAKRKIEIDWEGSLNDFMLDYNMDPNKVHGKCC